MTTIPPDNADHTSTLGPNVERALAEFVDSCGACFRDDLLSVVLFGSAAEGRLRATSDVNVLVLLKVFDKAAADRMREPVRLAKAIIDLHALFIVESELEAAMEAFALRFADIVMRHRVLFGPDPLAGVNPPREALIRRLKQVLLNLQIRARERYIVLSPREEQLVRHIADSAGPLRSAAASLLQLEGSAVESPKAALEAFVARCDDMEFTAAVAALSIARETQALDSGTAAPVAITLMRLIGALRDRAEALQ
jgi:predicted nucleotidyltransferase